MTLIYELTHLTIEQYIGFILLSILFTYELDALLKNFRFFKFIRINFNNDKRI